MLPGAMLGTAESAPDRRQRRDARKKAGLNSLSFILRFLNVRDLQCSRGVNGRQRERPHRAAARDDGPHFCMTQTDRVTMMNRNRNTQTNILRATRAAGMGCMLVAAFCAAIAHAEDTGVKANAKRAGQTVGATAREVGKEAKTAAPGVWQSMKNAGSSIAAGAKHVGTEIKSTAMKVGKKSGPPRRRPEPRRRMAARK
jgi:hypothetical protein